MHRFHQIWIDIDADEFGGLSAERLFSLVERLPAYEGALAARITWLQEEEKKRNPSRAVLDQPGTHQVEGNAAAVAAQFGAEVVRVEGGE